jgi:hypothetical protein
VPFSGGGYLRLFPLRFFSWCTRRLNRRGIPVVVYLHPREVDPYQPRLPLSLKRRFKCYVNIHTTRRKLESMVRRFQFTTVTEVIEDLEKAGRLRSVPAVAGSHGCLGRRD